MISRSARGDTVSTICGPSVRRLPVSTIRKVTDSPYQWHAASVTPCVNNEQSRRLPRFFFMNILANSNSKSNRQQQLCEGPVPNRFISKIEKIYWAVMFCIRWKLATMSHLHSYSPTPYPFFPSSFRQVVSVHQPGQVVIIWCSFSFNWSFPWSLPPEKGISRCAEYLYTL